MFYPTLRSQQARNRLRMGSLVRCVCRRTWQRFFSEPLIISRHILQSPPQPVDTPADAHCRRVCATHLPFGLPRALDTCPLTHMGECCPARARGPGSPRVRLPCPPLRRRRRFPAISPAPPAIASTPPCPPPAGGRRSRRMSWCCSRLLHPSPASCEGMACCSSSRQSPRTPLSSSSPTTAGGAP